MIRVPLFPSPVRVRPAASRFNSFRSDPLRLSLRLLPPPLFPPLLFTCRFTPDHLIQSSALGDQTLDRTRPNDYYCAQFATWLRARDGGQFEESSHFSSSPNICCLSSPSNRLLLLTSFFAPQTSSLFFLCNLAFSYFRPSGQTNKPTNKQIEVEDSTTAA